jgi:hypothetical protein
MSSESSKPTLYERLGGVYSIAAVVDDFERHCQRTVVFVTTVAYRSKECFRRSCRVCK